MNELSKAAKDQLLALVKHYPMWPGDTLSHDAMRELYNADMAARDASGNWIPTGQCILLAKIIAAAKEVAP